MAAKPQGKEKFKAPPKDAPKTTTPPSSRLLYLVMALVTMVILVGGYLFYYFHGQQMRQRIEDTLSAMAQLKVGQIVDWRAARLVDANTLVGSPSFIDTVAKYIASPTDMEIRDKVLADLGIVAQSYPYQDILLVDMNGKVLLSVSDSVHRLSDVTVEQLAVAINERKAVITDFHYPPDSDSAHLDIVAPLFPWRADSPQAIGVVVLCIEPSQYLYPLLQFSPFPSETAETLLVERDGDEVLFLNDLRHQKDTALKMRIPLSRQEVPAVMAVLGKEGIIQGRDYRGVEVLAALEHIPDSPWYMVAKIDTSEAFAVWRSQIGFLMAFVAGLLVAALAIMGFIWQRRQRLAYQALYQAELELHQSQERFRVLIEHSYDAVTLLAADGTVLYDSPTIAHILGYSPLERIGRSVFDFVHPDERQDMADGFAKFTRQPGAVAPSEVLFLHKDGTPCWIEGIRTNLLHEPLVRAIVVNYRDVTERKRAEETLQQSEEKHRTILKEIEDSYFEVDLAGNLTFVNDSTCRSLRYSREELLGMNYRGFTAQEDIEHVYQTFNHVYRMGKPNKGFSWKVVRKDGTEGFVEATVSLLRSHGGEIIGFRGVGRDITERKKAEEERKQLEQKAQISSRLASVGEMAAGVAHEINNPLTGVIGYAQLLMDREDVPFDIRKDLTAINEGSQRMAGIVKRLLAFSRQTKPERRYVDINELIESTLALRDYHLKVNNIKVTIKLAPDVPETVADPGQIQQVLLNLIVNAETEMKLAHGRGKLTITTEKSDNIIKISVKDDGPGIKPELMDRIFDPFFTTREVGQGTGLGLSLCYGIIAEHNGKIYAESKPGKGATFIVELPVVTEAELPEPVEPVVEESEKVTKARILMVDDEQVVRELVKRVLGGEGYEVDTIDNAADALKMIADQRYNLILLDIKMPGMDGAELYRRIQKIAKSLARRVVFITGDIVSAATEKFLSETKVARIDKPFTAEQLRREVKRALSGGR
ncbi:MAG: PAS domain S-box protein [Chloroflexi bacterium]|nr:PAS domain S-box protein [Chloroflexota bacterium]